MVKTPMAKLRKEMHNLAHKLQKLISKYEDLTEDYEEADKIREYLNNRDTY